MVWGTADSQIARREPRDRNPLEFYERPRGSILIFTIFRAPARFNIYNPTDRVSTHPSYMPRRPAHFSAPLPIDTCGTTQTINQIVLGDAQSVNF